jgi:single-strand DNA-binding protein
MPSLNKVAVMGHVGRDPEVKHMSSGEAVVNISIAATEKWKDKETGEKKEHTEWVRCMAFGRQAEIIGEYVLKGDPLYIEGKMRTRKYDKDGVDHYTTEVIVSSMQLIGGRKDTDSGIKKSSEDRPKAAKPSVHDIEDDIPF